MTEPVYFDSSIWIAYVIGTKDRNFPYANSLITKMDSEEFQVYVSKLVLMETIDVIKKKVTQYETHDRQLDSNKELEIIGKIKNKIQHFVDSITNWESQGKLILNDPTDEVEAFHYESLANLKNYWGKFQDNAKCRGCKRPVNPNYSYRGLGQWDFQHAIIAKSLNASVLYSTDRDFSDLNGHNNFLSLQFMVKP